MSNLKDILQLIKEEFEQTRPGKGCIYITSEGTYINLYPKLDCHEDLCWWLEDEYDIDLPYEDEEWAIRTFDWIRCRETPIDDNVIELPKKITTEQYYALEEWMENIASSQFIDVGAVDSDQFKAYNIDYYSPQEVIGKIKRFYNTGTLTECKRLIKKEQKEI